jgi:hypothetical protein
MSSSSGEPKQLQVGDVSPPYATKHHHCKPRSDSLFLHKQSAAHKNPATPVCSQSGLIESDRIDKGQRPGKRRGAVAEVEAGAEEEPPQVSGEGSREEGPRKVCPQPACAQSCKMQLKR